MLRPRCLLNKTKHMPVWQLHGADILDGHKTKQINIANDRNRKFATSRSLFLNENTLSSLRNDVLLYKSVSSDMLKQKWTDAYSFYEQFSHMDEVREAHNKVISIQVSMPEVQKYVYTNVFVSLLLGWTSKSPATALWTYEWADRYS